MHSLHVWRSEGAGDGLAVNAVTLQRHEDCKLVVFTFVGVETSIVQKKKSLVFRNWHHTNKI